MNKTITYFLLLTLLVAACGTKKEVVVERPNQVSSKDYPYIEKFHEALRLKTKGRLNEAIAKFEECLTIRQDDDAVYYALSQLYIRKEDYLKSAECIKKAAEIDPKNTWYIQELAYMYYEQKDFPNSVANFKKLVDIEPRNVDWQYGYAEALVQTGAFEKAIGALNRTEDQVGVNPELSVQKYNLYMEMKSEEKAVAELERARETFPNNMQLLATLVDHYFRTGQAEKGVSMLEQLVKEDPDNGRAHLALADVYRQGGDKEASYRELKLAFQSTDVDIDTKMKILINIHEASYKIDPEVYEIVDMMVEMYPKEAKAHSIQGDFLLRADKEEEALAAYSKALKYDKSEFAIWNQVLLMEYQAGKYEALYEHSKECLTLFPSITTVYLLHGVSANQLKKYDEAVDILAAGKELVVNDAQMKAEFCGQIGDAHFGMKEYSEGQKAYKEAIETDKSSMLLKNNYALRLSYAKVDLDLAVSLAKQAVTGAPNQSLFVDTYGWALFQKGDYSAAKQQFENAYDLNDQDKMIVEHMGDVNAKLGNMDKAIEYWTKAKELGSLNQMLDKKLSDKKFYEPIY